LLVEFHISFTALVLHFSFYHLLATVLFMLCVIVMKAISTEFRIALPWELLYANDLVVIATPPPRHRPAVHADTAERSHYVVIIRDGSKLVTRVRVMLP